MHAGSSIESAFVESSTMRVAEETEDIPLGISRNDSELGESSPSNGSPSDDDLDEEDDLDVLESEVRDVHLSVDVVSGDRDLGTSGVLGLIGLLSEAPPTSYADPIRSFLDVAGIEDVPALSTGELRILVDSVRDIGVQDDCLHLLLSLLLLISQAHEEHRVVLGRLGLCPPLLSILEVSKDLQLIEDCCALLSEVSRTPWKLRLMISSIGVGSRMIEVLDVRKDAPQIQLQAISVIANLAEIDRSRTAFVEAGVIQNIVKAMMIHRELPSVQARAAQALANLSFGSAVNKGYVLKEGGIRAIVDALKLYCGNEMVVRECCRSLTALSCDDNARADLLEKEAIQIVSKVVRGEFAQEVKEMGLNILANLCVSSAVRASAVSESVISTCVDVMKESIDSEPMQCAGLAVLANFAHSPRLRLLISDASVADILVSLVARSCSNPLFLRACSLLTLLLDAVDSDRLRFCPTIPVVASYMRHNVGDASVQEAGCRVLSSLAKNGECRHEILRGGGVEVIATALQRHSGSSRWVVHGADAVRNLCAEDSSDEMRGRLVDLGCSISLIRGLNSFSSEGSVVSCCAAIGNLAVSGRNRGRLAEEGAIDAIVSSVKKFPQSLAVQIEGIGAILNIAGDSATKDRLLRSRAVESVVRAMCTFPDEKEFQALCCCALASCAGDAACAHEIVKDGGLVPLRDCIRQHMVPAAITVTAFISLLTRHQKALLESGLIDAVVAAMRERPENPTIQIGGLLLLRNLTQSAELRNELISRKGRELARGCTSQFPADPLVRELGLEVMQKLVPVLSAPQSAHQRPQASRSPRGSVSDGPEKPTATPPPVFSPSVSADESSKGSGANSAAVRKSRVGVRSPGSLASGNVSTRSGMSRFAAESILMDSVGDDSTPPEGRKSPFPLSSANMGASPQKHNVGDPVTFQSVPKKSTQKAVPPKGPRTSDFVSRDEWTADRQQKDCSLCKQAFSLVKRRHHCRRCGSLVCSKCSNNRLVDRDGEKYRLCDKCCSRR